MNMNMRSKNRHLSNDKLSKRKAMLRGLETLESRHLLAGEIVEIRLDALDLNGTTPITQVQEGQEFLLRGQIRDINTDTVEPTNGAFSVFTDISYASSEVTPMVSEVQMLGFTGVPTGGTFTLTYNGVTTAPINYEWSQGPTQAKNIQDALNALPALNGNVRVDRDLTYNTSLPNDRYFIRFINGLANTNVNQITADPTNLLVDPSDTTPAGISMSTRGEGVRSDSEAFKQAFAYNSRTNGTNPALEKYPELRLAADQPDVFQNVGGNAALSPVGKGYLTYFLVRLKATSGGADGQLVFTNALTNQPDLGIYMFGPLDPQLLTAAQVKFTYGDSTPDDGLQIAVTSSGITAAPDSGYTVLEDSTATTLTPSPLANDTQTGSGSLTITAVSAGSAGGTLTIINGGADVSYKPAANYFGPETFTYTVGNGQASTTGTISISVTPVNDAPSFTKGSNITVDEDAGPQTIANWATNILAGPPNESSQTLSFTVTTNNNALFETLPKIAADGTLTFKTKPDATGQATVTVYLKDSGTKTNGGENQSASQNFTITVRGVNDAPVHTVPGARTTSGATPILFQGSTQIQVFDVDSGTSDITTTLSVTHGQLKIGGTIAAGLDVTGDNSTLITLTGTSAEINQALSLLTYTPLSGYVGSDTLQVVTNDNGNTGSGGAKSVTDNIEITVQAGAIPEAVNDSATMDEDGSPITIDVLLNDGVHPGTKGIIKSVQQPAPDKGTVVIDNNGTPADPTDDKLVFTPAADFNGQVQFTYVMNDTDGSGNDSTGLVTVTVNAVNDAPTSAPNYFIFDEDTTLVVPTSQSVLNNDGDVDGDTLTAVLVTQPKKGTLTFNGDGSFTYVPNPDVYGQDVFKYQAQDPSGALSPARTVTLFITAKPDNPVATDKTYTLREDTTLWVAADKGLLVGATDADGDLTFKARRVTAAAHGTVSVMPDGRFSYTPAANFFGTDSFTYQVVDSTGRLSAPQTVTLNVTAVNDRPNSVGEHYTTRAGAWLVVPAMAGVLSNDTDADGDALRAMRASLPAHGKVWVNADGSFSYEPNAGFVGTDSFEYWAIDSANVANSFSPRTTVTITVASVNQAPVTVAHTYSATEDTDLVVNAANGLLKGSSDPEGNPVFVKVVGQPSKGQVDWSADGSFIYKPNANAFGTETFTFQVSDGQANSALRTVTINIAGVNDPPPVVDDRFDVVAGVANQSLGDLLANDRKAPNPDGAETLSLVSFQATTAKGGKVQHNANGEFLYTPKAGFIGTDTFTYVVGDGKGGRSTAQVTLDVKAPPSTLVSGYVYRDTNNNGTRDAGEIGIGNVEVLLTSSADPTKVFRAVTDGSGRYQFTNVGAGTFTITERQPEYLTDGKESLGSAGGTVGGDSFTFTVPKFGLPNNQAINYNFGEGVLILGQTTNGNPPLQLSLEELAASSSNQGALLALNGNSQSWFTTLDPSWANVRSMAVQVAPNSSSLSLTLVVNQNGLNLTYQGVIGRTSSAAMGLRFRVMATNNQDFQILRLDGVLDLSDFTLVNGSAAGTDAVLANW